MRDLADPFWIKFKAVLFLVLGMFSAALLVSERPTWKIVLLLVVTVWSFCRLYYFAFYVIEKYLDPRYRFSGLLSSARYLATRVPASEPCHSERHAQHRREVSAAPVASSEADSLLRSE